MASGIDWTEETIARLRAFWRDGHSTAEIGRRMGTSKNSVVGKAHRLGLPPRPNPIRGKGAGSPPNPPAPARTRSPSQPPPRPVADSLPLERPPRPPAALRAPPTRADPPLPPPALAKPEGPAPSRPATRQPWLQCNKRGHEPRMIAIPRADVCGSLHLAATSAGTGERPRAWRRTIVCGRPVRRANSRPGRPIRARQCKQAVGWHGANAAVGCAAASRHPATEIGTLCSN